MKPVQLKAEVVRTEKLADDIYRLTVMAPEIAHGAKPGQFVMVRPTPCHDPFLRRPFSIHQVSDNGRLQILFKVIGRGTNILSGTKAGEYLDLVGPLGRGFREPSSKNLCLLGGGMGIAPLLFLAKWLLRKKSGDDGLNIILLLGAATSTELLSVLDDFEGMGLRVYTATDDGSLGHHGFVTDLLTEKLKDGGKEWMVCSCGPYPMMRKVAGICLDNNWHCQVSLETIMACGIKACLGCAVPKPQPVASGDQAAYVHVCKDGPVFDAGEVKWI